MRRSSNTSYVDFCSFLRAVGVPRGLTFTVVDCAVGVTRGSTLMPFSCEFLFIPARCTFPPVRPPIESPNVDFCSFLRAGCPTWISAHSCAPTWNTSLRRNEQKSTCGPPKNVLRFRPQKPTTLLCYLARQQMRLTSWIFTSRSRNLNSTNRAR